MIQLKDSDQCVVVKDDSSGARVELQRCEQQMTGKWKFQERFPLPTQVSARNSLSNLWHEIVAFSAMAGVGLLCFGAWFLRPTGKANMLPTAQGGVSMATLESSDDRSMATATRTGKMSMMTGNDVDGLKEGQRVSSVKGREAA